MDLDDSEQFSKIDKNNAYKLIADLPKQCQNAWEEISQIVLPSFYLKANKVLILGMGGSGIGGELAKSFAQDSSEIQISTHNNYGIPAWVDEKTLVIAVSYSGNTEEVIDGFVEASKKNAKLVAITTGGELEKLAFKFRCPLYRFRYDSPPRSALGYLLIGILGILKKLNIVDLATQDIDEAVTQLKEILEKNKLEIPKAKNQAKSLAEKLAGSIPIILGTDTTTSVALRWKTQFNENSKVPAYAEKIPESTHNSIVGLLYPQDLKEKIYFIILKSGFDNPRSRIRQDFILEILKKKKFPVQEIKIPGTGGKLSEMFSLIYIGDLTSYYLAILNEVDPYPVEIITKLKKHLKESGSG